jgi:hypothetical protein
MSDTVVRHCSQGGHKETVLPHGVLYGYIYAAWQFLGLSARNQGMHGVGCCVGKDSQECEVSM